MGRWLALMVMAAVSLGAATSPGSASAGADRGAGIVVRVYFADQEDLNQLATELDVWEVNHQARYLVALLLPGQQAALVAAGYRVEPAPEKDPRAQLLGQPLAGQAGGIPGFPCYRTVEETHADLEALALANPTLAEWFKVGESWEKAVGGGPGYDLFILKLTNRTISGPKPVLALMAAIHAREYTTAEMAARFAQDLVDGYATDPDATWLLDHHEIHILAQANPDGRKIAETGLLWRKNVDDDDGCSNPDAWGTDLNRNSSFQWGGGGASTDPCSVTYRGPAAASEPEVQAAQLYLAGIFPDQRGPDPDDPAPADATGIFISLHSYSELVFFPYGFRGTPTPNDAELRTLGRRFGYFNGYQVCQGGEPGCIYQTSGTTDDWSYGELGVASYTFELGTSFFQSCSSFENAILPDHLPALCYAAKSARRPYQDPLGPDTLAITPLPAPVVGGQPFPLTATADDTRFDSNGWGTEPTQNIAAARYSIDTPLWTSGVTHHPMDPADGAFDSPVEALMALVETTGLAPGRHILFVESQDADGNWGVDSAAFFEIAPECSDGIDNDDDGTVDFPDDPGCDGTADLSERSPLLACDDGTDNDSDGRIDFDPVTYANPGDETTLPSGSGDPGCFNPSWFTEKPQCQDGVNNDTGQDPDPGHIDYDGGQSIHGDCSDGTCPPGVSDPNGDGVADPDPQCVGLPWKNKEKTGICGVGAELALLLPLMWLTWRRRRRA
jgi:hypothetical protein